MKLWKGSTRTHLPTDFRYQNFPLFSQQGSDIKFCFQLYCHLWRLQVQRLEAGTLILYEMVPKSEMTAWKTTVIAQVITTMITTVITTVITQVMNRTRCLSGADFNLSIHQSSVLHITHQLLGIHTS